MLSGDFVSFDVFLVCNFLKKALQENGNVRTFAAPKQRHIMKLKQLLLLSVALFTAPNIYADPVLVPIRPVPTTPTDGNHPRSPIVMPLFYLDGYTLTAEDNTIGCTVAEVIPHHMPVIPKHPFAFLLII